MFNFLLWCETSYLNFIIVYFFVLYVYQVAYVGTLGVAYTMSRLGYTFTCDNNWSKMAY